MLALRVKWARVIKVVRMFALWPSEMRYLRRVHKSGLFDATFYRGAHPGLHAFYRRLPLRHFILQGEAMGLQPNPQFSPSAYLRMNPDVAESGMRPFFHYLLQGHAEKRPISALPTEKPLPQFNAPVLRFDPNRDRKPVAVLAHIYYPDLWEEFCAKLTALDIDYDLFVTVTWRGSETEALIDRISHAFPDAFVTAMPNRGRDILPFVSLVNAGAFDGYAAVCKIHTKKSPHRPDGQDWRRHLIDGVMPQSGAKPMLAAFLNNRDAAFWVADGQCFEGSEWWGSNQEKAAALLRRVEIRVEDSRLTFPAGSIYWVKPIVLGMIKALHLTEEMFEPEEGQVDATLAHAFERAVGMLAGAAGQHVLQTSELSDPVTGSTQTKPNFTSAFYLPQFHPIPENDAWWGKGFTEWRSALAARSMYPGHLQPMLPGDLGFYDLRATEVMGEQAALARGAGVDAFCVYHYWFDGRRVLEQPLDRLLKQPDVEFPFYLCWANESWRRNWDGLSGQVLLEQTYAEGFEDALVASSLPYMADHRYQRLDGARPRFVIYRPEDMPNPEKSVERMRQAWRAAGIGEVDLGAVSFHIKGKGAVNADNFDFWVEMPPHGLVEGQDYLFGGPLGDRMGPGATPASDFGGLIYDYNAAARRSCTPQYIKSLPPNTIAGIMPSWDNTARRGAQSHIAYGGHPAAFRRWLSELQEHRISGSYRGELFINAWNEWAEKAVLEPSETFGRMYLDILGEALADG